jgi:hypothetical protein
VRLGPSTPGDYVRARVLVPQNLGVTTVESAGALLAAGFGNRSVVVVAVAGVVARKPVNG